MPSRKRSHARSTRKSTRRGKSAYHKFVSQHMHDAKLASLKVTERMKKIAAMWNATKKGSSSSSKRSSSSSRRSRSRSRSSRRSRK
jgi:hypothetical protein